MLKIETLEIAGFASVLQALRLPFGKECRSAVYYKDFLSDLQYDSESRSLIDAKDMKLLSTLVKRGDEHSKAIRGLMVYAEISAPLSFWSEADTYRIGTERLSSESTMHTIGNGGISIYNFHVPDIIYDILGDKKEVQKNIKPLFIEEPKELKKVNKFYFGREYEIWNNGDIYSMPFDTDEVLPNGAHRNRHFDRQKIKIGKTKNQQGYYQVRLGGRNGKTMLVHRVLAECFVENPNNYDVVNHINGDKSDCSISNLEWCTSSYNNKHAFDCGLKEISIKQRYLHYKKRIRWSDDDIKEWSIMRDKGLTLKEIAEKYDTTDKVICQYTNGDRFKNLSDLSYYFSIAMYYEDLINRVNGLASLYEETGDFDYVCRIKEILPTSFIQKRIQSFSYQCLRRIYFQRRNHRLPMWHDFCKWIEGLPFAKELITCEKEVDYEQ